MTVQTQALPNRITIENYSPASVGPAPRFPMPSVQAPAQAGPDCPDACKGIPHGLDGLVHAREGVLRAVSKTVGTDGIRHEHLLTYAWNGRRFQILSCNCRCCFGRNAPACRHALGADTLLNARLVSAALLASHAGQTGPCEVVRAWETKAPCFGCGGPTLYVHTRRPVSRFTYRQNDRKTLCVNPKCGLWRHEA